MNRALSFFNGIGGSHENTLLLYFRKMDDGKAREIVCASAGVHIVLPDYYSPSNMGLLDPATSDGRVIFFLPWQNHTIAGTTDTPCKVNMVGLVDLTN